MQTFIDTATGEPWQFDDHDDIRLINGVYQVFDVNGKRITSVPETLVPAPDDWTPPSPPPAIPSAVTMRQARLVLLGAGLLAQVDAAIDALPEPDRTAARIEWEYSQEVQRDKPFVQMLAPALGLNDEQLDALFIQGAAL